MTYSNGSLGWTVCSLGEVTTLQRGFDITKAEQSPGPYPVVSSSGINSWHSDYKVRGPGVVIGRKGSLGTAFFLPGDFWPHDTTLWVKDFHGNDPKFCFFLLKTLRLEQFDVGAANPTLNRNHIHGLPLRVPSLTIQRRIASILSAYDDLIENNTRRIAILEEMARRLYEEWLVHFHFPGHEQVRRVESELGLVPEGWEIRPLGDLLAHHVGGGWGEESQSAEFGVPAFVIRGTDIPSVRRCSLGAAPLRFHKEANFRSRKLAAGDIVFEVSGGSKDQPVGRAVLIGNGLLSHQDFPVICASFCRLVRANAGMLSPQLLQLHFERIYKSRDILQYQTQSTGITNFRFSVFLEKELILVPPLECQHQYTDVADSMFRLRESLGLKNTNLRAQRDLLLPKLISGEIDVAAFPEPEAVAA